jgi:hypothetical protein
MSIIRSRRTLRVIIRVCGPCRLHKIRLAAYERLGYLADGY